MNVHSCELLISYHLTIGAIKLHLRSQWLHNCRPFLFLPYTLNAPHDGTRIKAATTNSVRSRKFCCLTLQGRRDNCCELGPIALLSIWKRVTPPILVPLEMQLFCSCSAKVTAGHTSRGVGNYVVCQSCFGGKLGILSLIYISCLRMYHSRHNRWR